MIKWPIAYKDYNGVDRKEDFYFHLTEAEISELELIHHRFARDEVKDPETGEVTTEAKSGWRGYLEDVMNSQDGARIIEAIKDMIRRAYGIRTPDGRSFIKTEHDYLVFAGTPAYSQLFMELAYNPDRTIAFFTGILPANLQEMAREAAKNGFRPGADTSRPTPPAAGQHVATPEVPAAAAPVNPPTDGWPTDPTPSMPPLEEKSFLDRPLVEEAPAPEVVQRAQEIAAEEGHTVNIQTGYSPNALQQAQEEAVQDYSQIPVQEERPAQPYGQ